MKMDEIENYVTISGSIEAEVYVVKLEDTGEVVSVTDDERQARIDAENKAEKMFDYQTEERERVEIHGVSRSNEKFWTKSREDDSE